MGARGDGHYTRYNAQAIDRWVREGWEWGVPLSPEAYRRAKAGDRQVVPTPNRPVPRKWLGELRGRRVLGLASGGGQQMPVSASQGALCTVLDLSDEQLQSERMVALREGYEMAVVKADMTRPLPFADESFDLIFHPVSNCYIREVKPLWRECFRVLAPGGALLAGLDNGLNFLFDEGDVCIRHHLPWDPLADPAWEEKIRENNDSLQFSHPIEEQIGGQLEAGFVLRDLYEDTNGYGPLKECGAPCFYATYALKPAAGVHPAGTP